MAVKIRLARHGAKKAPYYRIVVADSRARRDVKVKAIKGGKVILRSLCPTDHLKTAVFFQQDFR